MRGDGDLAEEGGGIAGAGDRLPDALSYTDGAAARQPEHAEAVSDADAEMDGERGGRDEPAVIAGIGNDPLFVEQADAVIAGVRACSSRHFAPPERQGSYGPCISRQFDRGARSSQGNIIAFAN